MRCSTAFALSLLCATAPLGPVRADPAAPPPADKRAAQPGAGAKPAESDTVASLEELLARFARLSGMTARYREEKRIALLKRPLLSEGTIAFAAPGSLVRRAERPEPAVLLLEGETLRVADASGARRIDLAAHPVVRQFVLTFVHVLAGDRAALERLYQLRFESLPGGLWRLSLTPKQAELARMIAGATLLGRGAVVERMELREQSGDSTVLQFSEVDLGVRFDAAARARVFSLPEN
jgi:hypothetical protein